MDLAGFGFKSTKLHGNGNTQFTNERRYTSVCMLYTQYYNRVYL